MTNLLCSYPLLTLTFLQMADFAPTPTYLFGMGGSSHTLHYPIALFSDNFILKLQKIEYTMTDFIAQNTLDKFLDFSPRLDFVLLFLGGNDLDTKYYTDQQNRTTFYGFMNAARVLHQHNIRPYIVSIQERRRPKHTTYRIYENRRQSLNYQLGTTLTWTLGYNPVIAVPDHNNEFTSDGIHLATVDYYNLTQRIEQVIDYDTKPTTYRQTPLTKNLVWLSKFRNETKMTDIGTRTN